MGLLLKYFWFHHCNIMYTVNIKCILSCERIFILALNCLRKNKFKLFKNCINIFYYIFFFLPRKELQLYYFRSSIYHICSIFYGFSSLWLWFSSSWYREYHGLPDTAFVLFTERIGMSKYQNPSCSSPAFNKKLIKLF